MTLMRVSRQVDKRGKLALQSDFFLGCSKTLRAWTGAAASAQCRENTIATTFAARLILTPVDLPLLYLSHGARFNNRLPHQPSSLQQLSIPA